MRTTVERLAAHEGGRFAGAAKRQQHLTVQCALPHRVVAVIGEKHRTVGGHVQTVSSREQSLTPGSQEISLTIEHHHWVLAAIEQVHIILLVDAHRAYFTQRPTRRNLRPMIDLLVTIVSVANDDGHVSLPGPPQRHRVVAYRYRGGRPEPGTAWRTGPASVR